MEYRKKNGITYASLGGAFPAGSTPVTMAWMSCPG